MSQTDIQEFASLAAQIVGHLDVIAQDAKPHPWFCKDIFRKRDLQWAGYIGDISKQEHALVFGINLEFTPAWRRIYPNIKKNFKHFSELLRRHQNFEWHWMARPGVIAKNPGIEHLWPKMWTFQVDTEKWLSELEEILERKKMWSTSTTVPIRPQIQIMRCVGLPVQLTDLSLIQQAIQQTVLDLQAFVQFIG